MTTSISMRTRNQKHTNSYNPTTLNTTLLASFSIMENFFLSSSTNTTNTINTTSTISPSNPNMSWSQNSQFAPIYGSWSYPSIPSNTSTQSYCYPAVQYNMLPPPPLFQSLQIPYTYTQDQASGQYPSVAYPLYPFSFGQNEIGMQGSYLLQPNVVSMDQERRNLHADSTKAARCKRKEARQRSLSRAASSSGPSSTQEDTERQVLTGASTHVQNSSTVRINRDLYNFLTPDNKRLRMLLSKVLKKSDVGALGRIVLPKKETEKNLPPLYDREGIQIKIRDIFSELSWKIKFKFWTNNTSRMYVLENTGDFVKEYGMESGDSLTLYEDESNNLYFTIRKAESSQDELTFMQYNYVPQPQPSSFNNISSISTLPQPAAVAMHPSSLSQGIVCVANDHHMDDWFTNIDDMFPNFYSDNFLL